MGIFEGRREHLEALLDGLDSFLITDPKDVFYYTGYLPSGNIFLSAGRRWTMFATSVENEAETSGVDVAYFSRFRDVAGKLKGTMGYDEGSLLAVHYNFLSKKAKLVPSGKLIKLPRGVKDNTEIGLMKSAIKITAAAFAENVYGRKETDVARSIEMGFMQKGGGIAFPTIVAAGRNGYYIHHRPGARRIKKQDMCIVDCGATSGGYCADVTRTFYQDAGRRQRAVYSWLLEISGKVIDSIRPGVKFEELQGIYKREMAKRRCVVMHYIGHSVGLDVHEPLETLEAGSVITVEPGIYIKGSGGARVEDMVLVKKSGAEVLTRKINK